MDQGTLIRVIVAALAVFVAIMIGIAIAIVIAVTCWLGEYWLIIPEVRRG